MGDKTQVFLTDERTAVLNGTYQGAANTERTHKSRIRDRARTALKELIQVAHSPAIDNAEVFDPNDLARLIDALMAPEGTTITPRWNFDGDPADFRDQYQYQLALHGRLSHALDGYGDMLHRDHRPGESPTFDLDTEPSNRG